MRYEFIDAEKAIWPVRITCRVLEVSRSGYYAWRRCKPSKRAEQNARLTTEIRGFHAASRETYGSPRIHLDLMEAGWKVGRKRVEHLMRSEGIQARIPKRFRHTTDSKHSDPVAPNILARSFKVDHPNRVWVTDITYVWTWEGWLYLAVVVDLFARRVVGWSVASHMRAELALNALQIALGNRDALDGLTHHSDRGSQYTSSEYQELLRAHGIVCSMSRKGDCWDNAVAESFFGTLKQELIHRQSWPTRREAADAIVEYIELFYNARRRHSANDGRSPVAYERIFMLNATHAA